ncbi:MAG: glycine/betaine ABC transporter substrate-binding protein, partial [Halobacteriovoraceae bacterium]|nr:glycine/betaine ABC transporter substrate-binding protein [Halobacteriovoraceae bacterium]
KKPILILNWTPNFIEKLYDGKFVEFPNYSKKCETDPKWGTNKKEVYDCGNPKNGWLKKVVSRNFPKEWPCAFEILKNIDFNNSMISELTKQLEYGKMPLKRVAYQWFDQHKDLWKKWIPKNCIAK